MFGDIRTVVVPITHSPPRDPAAAIPLPAAAKGELGLDADASWVCLDEVNVFSWPGFDLRPIPGSDRIDYGALPADLFEQIKRRLLELQRTRRLKAVGRD